MEKETKKEEKTGSKTEVLVVTLSAERTVYDVLRSIGTEKRPVKIIEENGSSRNFVPGIDSGSGSGKQGWQETGEKSTAIVRDKAETGPMVIVAKEAVVSESAKIDGYVDIEGFARVGGNAKIRGLLTIKDWVKIHGDVELIGTGGSIIVKPKDGEQYIIHGRIIDGNTEISNRPNNRRILRPS